MACEYSSKFRSLLDCISSYNAWIKVCRRRILDWIVLFDMNITIVSRGECGTWFEVYQNSLEAAANTPNSSKICTFKYFDFVAFWRQLYSLKDIHLFWSTTSGALRITGEVISEHLGTYFFVSILSGSIRKHPEASVWLFRVAVVFSYNFETILHFAQDHLIQQNTHSIFPSSWSHTLMPIFDRFTWSPYAYGPTTISRVCVWPGPTPNKPLTSH